MDVSVTVVLSADDDVARGTAQVMQALSAEGGYLLFGWLMSTQTQS